MTTRNMTPESLFLTGVMWIAKFARANPRIPEVNCHAVPTRWRVNACGYYRPEEGIQVCLPLCAGPGRGGRAWSWPAYKVDRTPFGVIAHEYGHHVDWSMGTAKTSRFTSTFSNTIWNASGEEAPITTYSPDPGEWFAEMFRVFVCNHALLKELRPGTHKALIDIGFVPVSADSWRDALKGAPERTIVAAANQVERTQAARARKGGTR